MRRRPWILYVLLFLLLAGAGGVVWLTYHPQSPVFDPLVQWPVVGPWAERLREAYRPVEPETVAGSEGSPPRIVREGRPPRDEAALEALAARREAAVDAQIERFRAREFRWFRAGVAVREAPDPTAPVRLTLEAPQRFSFLEKRQGWARVRLGGVDGWIPVSAATLLTDPPLGREAAPVLPVPGLPAERRLLEAARAGLGAVLEGRVGAYPLLTDVEDGVLHRALDRVAGAVEGAYAARYGLTPQHPAAATVVLFRAEADYRAFQREEAHLAGLNPRGHTGHGIVALYQGRQPTDEVASTLMHELVHLINRRALGPALPPWLNEGMAEDVSLSFRDAEGRVDFTRLGGGARRTGGTVYQLRLGYGSLERLRRTRAEGELTPLEALVEMDWGAFVQSGDEEEHYAQSAFFLRYLLDDPGLAPRFRHFLGQGAEGEPLTPTTLQQALEKEWSALDAGFREYLEGEFRRYLE